MLQNRRISPFKALWFLLLLTYGLFIQRLYLQMSAVTLLAKKISRVFENDGALALCGHYTFPMPVQTREGYHLFQDRVALGAAFSAFVHDHKAQSLLPPIAQIAAIEMAFGHRFRIWADWIFPAIRPDRSSRYQTIYYCSLIGSKTGIEMIQFSGALSRLPDLHALERKSA